MGYTMLLNKQQYPALLSFIEQVKRCSADSDFNRKIAVLLDNQKSNESFRDEIRNFAELFFDQAVFVRAFSDSGINTSFGFVMELIKRVKYKFLPPLESEAEVGQFLSFLFGDKESAAWIRKIDAKNLETIFSFFDLSSSPSHPKVSLQIENALIILTHRLVTLGLDPYIVQKLPEADDTHSPFFSLSRKINKFLEEGPNELQTGENSVEALTELLRCEYIFKNLTEKKDQMGTSLHLTFLLRRAEQHVERIRTLLLLFSKSQEIKHQAIKELTSSLVKANQEKYSIRKFFKTNTGLLAHRIMSHTSEKGENYIGFSKAENRKLFFSAMGGGLIVVILVFIKESIHEMHLSLFFEGLLYGINYGIGFVVMHFLHFTLATKQPAMTASYIAKNIGNQPAEANVAPILKQIIRSQFISLFGNLVVALPLCFGIALFLAQVLHCPYFDHEAAVHHVESNHPLLSLSLIYAVFTGLFTTFSGLLTGYYDNKVVFSNFAERIANHPIWSKRFSPAILKKAGAFVQKNLGAIVGNMSLGLVLGGAGTFGKFLGLPFDTRHVTVSAGNFGIALGSDHSFPTAELITVFIGILLIGIINIFSSFLLSFSIACISRDLSAIDTIKMLYRSLFLRKVNVEV
jgi:site-specific recombinase